MAKLTVNQLKPGDILLYHGTSFVSNMIRLADGEPYSHAGLFIGDGEAMDNVEGKNIAKGDAPYVAEMVGEGLIVDSIGNSINGAAYVDVYRYYDHDRNSGDMSRVLMYCNRYIGEKNKYAYDQIVLLAIISSTYLLPDDPIQKVVRHALAEAADVIARIINDASGQKELMICSELVYRCFANAGLTVAIQRNVNEIEEHNAEHKSFIDNYLMAKKWGSTIADFVTPNDLGRSPNFQKIGTL